MNLKNRILFLFNSLKKYGTRGVVDFVLDLPSRIIRTRSKRRRLLQSMRVADPERGITLVGRFKEDRSLSKTMRDFARQLKKAGIPYQTLDVSKGKEIPQSEYDEFLTPEREFCANKYTKIIAMQGGIPQIDKRCENYAIHFWEFEDGFKEFYPDVYKERNVLALSDFNELVFKKELSRTITVRKILYPFQFDRKYKSSQKEAREKFEFRDSEFIVFFNFCFMPSYYRKNPEAVVLAFSKAIGTEGNVRLVLKTSGAKSCRLQYERLMVIISKCGLTEKVTLINDFLSQEDVVDLTNACDVYISLHRGEGFGLGIVEAMSLGKAVVVSDYSAVKEFCVKENSMLISCKEINPCENEIDYIGYENVKTWIEPNVDEAAEALRKLYRDVRFRKELGIKAQQFVKEYFSVKNFKASVERFLDE